jgi:AcrR family transcriptional regulator
MTTIRDTRREAILRAALGLFSRQGYHGTSMPEIAKAADISVGLIYYVFKSKEDILLTIVEESHAVHIEACERCRHIADPLERFDAVVRGLYTSLDAHSKLLIVLYRDLSALHREARTQILSFEGDTARLLVELIEEGQAAGRFARDIPDISLLASNVVGLGHLWALKKTWLFAPRIGLEEYIATQLAYFHKLLLDGSGERGDRAWTSH